MLFHVWKFNICVLAVFRPMQERETVTKERVNYHSVYPLYVLISFSCQTEYGQVPQWSGWIKTASLGQLLPTFKPVGWFSLRQERVGKPPWVPLSIRTNNPSPNPQRAWATRSLGSPLSPPLPSLTYRNLLSIIRCYHLNNVKLLGCLTDWLCQRPLNQTLFFTPRI